ncbi:SusC/RagA family TonB-linked outer membrane protein [Arachidicoccus terrestris]|uniref:SusC/RagA family TonB-linked outer membrane protein n=1 Tax=Arachidicoccus terrestris TaxID=2875539 RepID=UPI001CC5D944|nr:SusC/RagA family TonB-linked outer membrane protein [Arachidicoccus terrestris]UAY56955.1 SusC/RagA family TonB-linked outer membrane protein [Arachidicoccus terrestris]
MSCIWSTVYSQQGRQGKVLNASDSTGLALVTIKNLRTLKTVLSSETGAFFIEAKPSDSLSFSSVGYLPAYFRAGDGGSLNVYLHLKDPSLDEVVVVGYGTLKKRSVIGAVSEISGDAIKDRPTPNVTRALEGQVPGLNILPTDGKPDHGGKITIRGQGTSFKARKMGGGEYDNTLGQGGGALIIIDGVEGDLNAVNPDDIASISVLKDASSAAVYGARGAFGVILVTTKQAKSGKPSLNYSFNQSRHQRTVLWEDGVVDDPVQWTEGFRQSYLNASPSATVPSLMNNYFPYSDAWYEELKRRQADPTLDNYDIDDNGNYIYYGHTNWLSEFYKRSNMSSSHALSLTGGGENASFYVSGRYYTQNGIYKVGKEKFKKYNVRAKGTIKLRPWLTLTNNTTLYRNTYLQPMMHYGQMVVPRQIDMFAFPVANIKNPDGSWTQTAARSGYAAFAEGTSFQYNNDLEVFNSTSIEATVIPKVFNIRGVFSYKAIRDQRQRAENMYTYYNGINASGQDHDLSSLEDWRYNTEYISANIVGTFTPDLGPKHELNIVGGWNLEDSKYKNQKLYRTGNLYPAKPGFTLMDGDYYSATSGGNQWGLIGLFSRINYTFNRKYLAEFSFRYDGSSKFPSNSQWGFFPSGSLGWLISQEDWFNDIFGSFISNMKIRGSFGALGNANISPYQFLEVMNFSKSSVLIDGQKASYTDAPSLIPDDITWEKIKTYDIGVDLSMFRNRLTFTGDYYKRYTTDLYTVGPNLPQVLGSVSPKGNYASSKTNGWEVSLGWRDKIGAGQNAVTYAVKAMMWDSRTWVTDYYNTNGDLTTYYKGMEIGEIWGFKTAGIYASNAEAANGPAYNFFKNGEMFQAYAGDLKFVDVNGDGIMTKGSRTLSDHGDMVIIGNSSPRYNFGFNLSLNWKGFGLSTFFQGVLKRDWYPWTESGFFWGQHNRAYNSLLKTQTGDNIVQVDKTTENWVVTNMDKNPYWTRSVSLAANRNDGPLTWENSHYLQNVAYVRLKNITIDYNLPATWIKAIGFTSARIFLTGENLWTYSPMFKHTKMFDPEVIESGDTDFAASTTAGLGGTGNGYSYPMLKNITLGVSVNF